jgi:hypothetical protein
MASGPELETPPPVDTLDGSIDRLRGAGWIQETARLSDNYPVPFYKKHCRYLFFNGIQQVWTASESTREEAENISCAPLKGEPVIHRRRKSGS